MKLSKYIDHTYLKAVGTETEINRKFNVNELSYGASLQLKKSKYSTGINWLHTEYSIPINPV